MLDQLKTLGLSDKEARIYEALVLNGPCKAGILIVKLDIHRSVIYETLEVLVHKGFVSKFSKRGVWHFQITQPESLLTDVRRKEHIAQAVIEQIHAQRGCAAEYINVYEGHDSFRAYWLQSLERVPEGTIDYAVGVVPHGDWAALLGPVFDEYMQLRVKKRITWKTIHFKITSAEQNVLAKYPDITEYRLWPQSFTPKGNFNIVHDTLVLQSMDPKRPRIIEMRDETMVAVFTDYFNALWEQATPVSL